MQRNTCAFYTKAATRCSNRSADGGDYCRVHARKAETLGPKPEGCPCVEGPNARTHRWCGQPLVEGTDVCVRHRAVRDRIAADAAAEIAREHRIRDLVDGYRAQNPQRPWMEIGQQLRARVHLHREDPRYLPDRDAFHILIRIARLEDIPVGLVIRYWMNPGRAELGWPADADEIIPVPLRPLERLAGDSQNVHTRAVSTQTNTTVDMLLALPVSPTTDTLGTLTTWWMVTGPKVGFAEYWRVMMDVKQWYETSDCKGRRDWLYKRVLDGLVTKILLMSEDIHTEVVKRLWEECVESVGMCCEGHISRLANVLVGFDAAVRPPVAIGEILQTKIAAIAGLAVSLDEKIRQATDVMNELGVLDEERAPWLEALA